MTATKFTAPPSVTHTETPKPKRARKVTRPKPAGDATFAVLHDRRIAYTEHLGTGPVYLLVHGIGGNQTDWARVTERLVETGQHVITVDLPGHGLSAKDRGDYSLGAMAPQTAGRRTRSASAVKLLWITEHVGGFQNRPRPFKAYDLGIGQQSIPQRLHMLRSCKGRHKHDLHLYPRRLLSVRRNRYAAHKRRVNAQRLTHGFAERVCSLVHDYTLTRVGAPESCSLPLHL